MWLADTHKEEKGCEMSILYVERAAFQPVNRLISLGVVMRP
jgi:hypothetical protein